MLRASGRPLVEAHDLFMFDLDGVIYIDGQAVPGVPDHLRSVRASGVKVAFVTNNASRSALEVSARLESLGVEADVQDVVTSAQAAASVLLERFGAGARVQVLGGPGLVVALGEAGLVPVQGEDAGEVVALATGYGPEVLWREIMRAAVAVREGLPWVASNTDETIPTSFGVAPGHGVLVRTIATFAGVEPVVAGKPSPPLLRETIQRTGGRSPVMVGDRLDTDILGARVLDIDSLLVLTGVTGLPELVRAPADQRPSFLSPTLAGAFEPHPVPASRPEGGYALGGWSARVEGERLVVAGEGSAGDWWRTVAVTAWSYLDAHGEAVDTAGLCAPKA